MQRAGSRQQTPLLMVRQCPYCFWSPWAPPITALQPRSGWPRRSGAPIPSRLLLVDTVVQLSFRWVLSMEDHHGIWQGSPGSTHLDSSAFGFLGGWLLMGREAGACPLFGCCHIFLQGPDLGLQHGGLLELHHPCPEKLGDHQAACSVFLRAEPGSWKVSITGQWLNATSFHSRGHLPGAGCSVPCFGLSGRENRQSSLDPAPGSPKCLHIEPCTEESNLGTEQEIHCIRGVQPVAHRLQAAQDGCEWGPTQNHKFT